MAFIIIVVVFVVYIGLYMVWESANVSLGGMEAFLRSFHNALFMPDNVVFMILRSLIILTFLYVLADYFMVKYKKARLKAKREKDVKNLTSTFVEKPTHVYRD